LVLLCVSSGKQLLVVTSVVMWDIPTFLVVISFSFFTYYTAKLNIEVERINLMMTTGDDEINNKTPLAGKIPRRMQMKNFRLNLLRPLFIMFNVLSFISFWIIFISCK
jgi:hypothetical protein